MEETSVVVVAGVVLILGLIALSILRKHLIEYKQLRLREILHQERLKAMETKMPLPELPVDDRQLLASAAVPPRNGSALSAIMWVRLVSLCLGLFMFFGGVGMSVGYLASSASGLSRIWTLGFIPALAGIGLLLFYRLSRGFDGKD
ncbi:MAG: hypothetical protein V3T72_14160 [Thermoanaerobaculia bacterium]